MKGKDFVSKKAKEAALHYLTNVNPKLQQPPVTSFFGAVSADKTTITDPNTGKSYNLQFTGTPRPLDYAHVLSGADAFVQGQQFKEIHVDANQSDGFVLTYDDTWFYIRNIGNDTKYYLPNPQSIKKTTDLSKFQGVFSSDGKGALLGLVYQKSDLTDIPTFYHQMATYAAFTNFKLISYDTQTLQTGLLAVQGGVTYPVPIDQGFSIAYVDFTGFNTNTIDLNTFSDGKVPVPDQGKYGSQAIYYPYSHHNSVFAQVNSAVSQTWDAVSGGFQYVSSFYGGGGSADLYLKSETHGVETLTWKATPNSSIFSQVVFTFNNDKFGKYEADIVCSFVNCYILGLTKYSWVESVKSSTFSNQVGPATGTITTVSAFSETKDLLFHYTYPVNFAYELRYLQSLDLWISSGLISSVTDSNAWIKNINYSQDSTLVGGGFTPQSVSGVMIYDANAQKYLNKSGVPDSSEGFGACQYAYRSEFTVGPPGFVPYADTDNFKYTVYSGTGRIWRNVFSNKGQAPNGQGTGAWPGYFISFKNDDGTNSPVFTYMDLNYDNLFFGGVPQANTVFCGRSTMVITNLLDNPVLEGIVSQTLNDGADFNTVLAAFRGRSFIDNNNTAYVYKQDFNKIYYYSAPALSRGNLANISSVGASISDNNLQDAYSAGIAQLTDFAALADVFGNSTLATQINSAATLYRTGAIPPAAQLAAIYAGLKGLGSDLFLSGGDINKSVDQLKANLDSINSVLSGAAFTNLGPDAIGLTPPDVFSDQIFSSKNTFPFANGEVNRTMKCVDSFLVQEYYILTQTDVATGQLVSRQEIIQGYNVDTAGGTTLGLAAAGSLIDVAPVLDYILPVPADKDVT